MSSGLTTGLSQLRKAVQDQAGPEGRPLPEVVAGPHPVLGGQLLVPGYAAGVAQRTFIDEVVCDRQAAGQGAAAAGARAQASSCGWYPSASVSVRSAIR